MTFLVADRVQETTNSPGTGTATLLGAVSGYQSFSTGIGANNTTFYVIADQLGTNWEVGLGALNATGTVLTRTTVYSSSNGGSTVNFATGTQYVWCDFPSSKSVIQGTAVNFSSIGATTAGTGTFTALVATSITDSGLTAGRVNYNGAGGLLTDSANMTFNGTTLSLANDASISGLTVGKGGGSNSENTALGLNALVTNVSGAYNTSVGSQALKFSTGSWNTAVGRLALGATIASDNTAVGGNAMLSTTTGADNSALGAFALQTNTTGSNNVAIGSYALISNTTASNNTAVGYQAGYALSGAGDYACFIGTQAGLSATTGRGNTFVGTGYQGGSGYAITTGGFNTILGGYTGNQSGLDIRTSSNNVVLSDGNGNPAARWANGGGWYQLNNSASWSTTSDERIKENVTPITNGLDVILALNPVEFDYKLSKQHTAGFIAQDYEKVLPDQIIEDANISEELKALTNGEPVKGIQQNLVPYLVKAIQELKAEVDSLKQQLAGK